jgi:hypothetical protein
VNNKSNLQSEPAPWVPASKSHTSSSVSERAQLHAVKAVETGVINVGALQLRPSIFSSPNSISQMTVLVQESEEKLARHSPTIKTGYFPDRIPWKDKGKEKAG